MCLELQSKQMYFSWYHLGLLAPCLNQAFIYERASVPQSNEHSLLAGSTGQHQGGSSPSVLGMELSEGDGELSRSPGFAHRGAAGLCLWVQVSLLLMTIGCGL